jgi:hypothetical protein
MRICVIGAGLFGCTAAIYLARAGHDVHLYEKSGQLLGAASTINQLRVHAGYHYPRSPRTIRECQDGLASFRAEYGEALIDGGEQYYAIAREGSKVTGDEFLQVCADHGLHLLDRCAPGFLNHDAVSPAVKVREARLDPVRLSSLVFRKLVDAGVALHMQSATVDLRYEYDKIVIAAYASTNEVAFDLGCPLELLQYELCEKPVIKLPDAMRDIGCVIMDGEFCSIDPWGETGLHVMGHVKHAIHAAHVGFDSDMPEHLTGYLNRGVVECKQHTAFERFREAGKVFIPAIEQAEWLGSMWTVRAVLPHMDETDARPTLVQALDAQCIRIFSGKLGTAVEAARQICDSLLGVERKAA